MKEQAYCEHCDKDVDYKIEETEIERTIRGQTFKCKYLKCTCVHCGSEVSPASIWGENVNEAFEEYKRRNGLLTAKQIKEIRSKHNMSQVDLAKFIHCGLKDVARWENGAIQNRCYDLLIRLVDEKSSFLVMQKFNKEASV